MDSLEGGSCWDFLDFSLIDDTPPAPTDFLWSNQRLRVITRSSTWINGWDFSGFAMRFDSPIFHMLCADFLEYKVGYLVEFAR
ncbi:hypothetical protein QN277_001859 [Acacia crassicarpa]|uniref:Uncharacterized protein n=1 Tax=Acacia crassicarpa TaxID=499986 RepID=A0AAE1N972_9FABA|nr:hypothetical protein QN277_001859 [Acacia crassicarpa]